MNLFTYSLILSSIIVGGAIPAIILNTNYIRKKWHNLTSGQLVIFGGGIILPLSMAVAMQITIANYEGSGLSGLGVLVMLFVAMGIDAYAAGLPFHLLTLEEGMLRQSEGCQEKLEGAERLIKSQQQQIDMMKEGYGIIKERNAKLEEELNKFKK